MIGTSMKSGRFALALAALIASATRAPAHDFWIEPSSYRPTVGQRIDIDLRVGEQFSGDPVERNPLRIVRFAAVDALGKEEPILGIDKRAPAGLWRAKSTGLFAIAYESNVTPIELEAPKFERYLEEEGLQHVIALRRERGDSAKPGREIYSRSVKSLVLAVESGKPEPTAIGWDRRLGLPLEIVPEKNPCALKVGDELPLRIYFRDEPLAGALVGFIPKSTPKSEVRTRTDADGRVTFKLTADGANMARVCWMVAAPADSASDWQSTWSSLTFDVRAPTPPK